MAAVRNRALAAIQRELNRQALGGKEGRFAVNRTLDHLKRCNVNLPDNVNSITLNLAGKEKANHGAKRFLYENVPQLKYKNPHVQFMRTKKQSDIGELTISYADGKIEQVPTAGVTQSQIMDTLISLTTTEKVPVEEKTT
ncbi:predicted protein [Nematostella vectensis]|uniref:Small ribosomal subunit protein mS25 n=1 Tax=Nematostella vectensis TaxID=45351 RepID=A7SU42_NEMVE|nr:28S ribosomal protein S25, mitochondrial [Nematostella vectensis]EDO32757.1 predicted protein [Nematostella vectensis]|eukprot:XP_001624857.1 predicted protein [Nematostella vectensis]